MAVVKPLYVVSGNLQEMDTTKVNELIARAVYQYSTSPSVVLSVVSSGGSLGTISDTRKQAGAVSTSNSSFPSEGTTQEPQTVTVNFDKITATTTTSTPTADTGKTFPVYYNSSGQIQAMSVADWKDTIIHHAIDLLASGTVSASAAGTYHITTSASVSGSTEVSGANTPVFIDTRADTSAYSAGSIPETQDQPTTIQNYYLQRIDGTDASYTEPYFLDGSGNYQTRQENDDYRAQEFPNGSVTTANTYNLRINKS